MEPARLQQTVPPSEQGVRRLPVSDDVDHERETVGAVKNGPVEQTVVCAEKAA